MIIVWFKFASSLKIFNPVLLLFLLPHIHYQNLKQSSKIQIVKENSTPKISINYNENISLLMTDNVPVFNIFLTQPTVIFSFLIKKKMRNEFWNNNIFLRPE